jgi:hypothetical protein
MGCDRVVITQTNSQAGTTTVAWLTYTMTGLQDFLVTFVQGGVAKSFKAKATDTGLSVAYTAATDCKATVTPQTAVGPSNDNASFAAPVPFPPTPIDPNAGRPVVLRACADAANVTVNWVPAVPTDPDFPVLGNYVSIIENFTKLTNFDVPGGAVAATTIAYAIVPSSSYQVIITYYDATGPNFLAASYPGTIPYP